MQHEYFTESEFRDWARYVTNWVDIVRREHEQAEVEQIVAEFGGDE